MQPKSHIDKEKLQKIPIGRKFEYKDIVQEGYPDNKHTEDGNVFKGEVENGDYEGIAVYDSEAAHVQYKKSGQ